MMIDSSTKRSRGTPMKTLLSQEMSKEIESKRKQTNVVARLMGLDEAPPTPHSVLKDDEKFGRRVKSSRVTLAKALRNTRQLEDGYVDKLMQPDREFREVHEVQRKGNYGVIQYERRLALVREKFIEAKRLVTDEKHLDSEEFQDELMVLNSNRNLFLKFLEEPKSLPTLPSQTQKITILKPSRKAESKNKEHSVNEPTRIVVLKPTMPKLSTSEPSTSSIWRDESLLSSVLSNGYVGDDSSFNRSENDIKFSDSEISSPISRHSLDYSNRYGSPCSYSSVSRASCSPDSSMVREAKKRLSERWSLVTSDVNKQEIIEERKSSSTLGEMLAKFESKKEETRIEGLNVSSSRSYDNQLNDVYGLDSSSMNLLPSQSVPIPSFSYEGVNSNVETYDSHVDKHITDKDALKSKKSSLKGKVSSLFSLKNKKSNKEKSISTNEDANQKENKSIMESSPALMKDNRKHRSISFRDVLSLENPSEFSSSSKIRDNLNQTSPTSILDASFENDTPDSSEMSNTRQPPAPIESVARTLSWDDANLDASSPDSLLLPVHNLLATAELDEEKLDTVFARWHSVDSPLDPSLLNRFLDRKEENAKSRERRSNQRLMFDSINAALIEVGKSCINARSKPQACDTIEDAVLLILREWFYSKKELKIGETDNSNVVVDTLLRRELGGNEWTQSATKEVDEISEMIGTLVLDDLIAEALNDLTVGRLL